jgi:hypothetical protein
LAPDRRVVPAIHQRVTCIALRRKAPSPTSLPKYLELERQGDLHRIMVWRFEFPSPPPPASPGVLYTFRVRVFH